VHRSDAETELKSPPETCWARPTSPRSARCPRTGRPLRYSRRSWHCTGRVLRFANAAGGLPRRARVRAADAGHGHRSGQGRLPGALTARLQRMRRLIAWCGCLMTAGSAETGREGRGGAPGIAGSPRRPACHPGLRYCRSCHPPGAPTVVSGGNVAGQGREEMYRADRRQQPRRYRRRGSHEFRPTAGPLPSEMRRLTFS
jgi:hypothetical protein